MSQTFRKHKRRMKDKSWLKTVRAFTENVTKLSDNSRKKIDLLPSLSRIPLLNKLGSCL